MVSVSINVDKVCRLCLREDDGTFQMTSLYDRLDLEETIRKCVQIEVLLGSYEPSIVCASCVLSLDGWSKFKELCDYANNFLQQLTQDRNESSLIFNSELGNLATPGFTPSQMSELSFSLLENDSLWNNSMSQQWNECVDSTFADSPVPKYTKKVQPPEDLLIDSESVDTEFNVLNKKNDSFPSTKTHWWNPKAISMKNILKENTEPPTSPKGVSKSIFKYNKYGRKTYSCNLCSEKYSKFYELLIHDSIVHKDLPNNFSCITCGKMFLTKARVEIHELMHREKLFHCNLCQKKFATKRSLDNHLNVHIGTFTCLKCDYKAPNSRNLRIHESIHSTAKNHKCNECEKCFGTLSSLRRHYRLVHQKSYLYSCDQCTYSTIQPSNLKHHKSTHIPQNFVCDHCGSCFKNQYLFMKHSRVHKDIQLECAHCCKKFKYKSSLKYHLDNSHKLGLNIKKYKCDMCENYFRNNRNLRNHINKKICLQL